MSKFQAIMDAKRGEAGSEAGSAARHEAPAAATTTPKESTRQETAIPRDSARLERKRGRPPGKRSDPNFEAVTAYIRKDTHRDVKIALLHEGKSREFSELVEDLLAGWIKNI